MNSRMFFALVMTMNATSIIYAGKKSISPWVLQNIQERQIARDEKYGIPRTIPQPKKPHARSRFGY